MATTKLVPTVPTCSGQNKEGRNVLKPAPDLALRENVPTVPTETNAYTRARARARARAHVFISDTGRNIGTEQEKQPRIKNLKRSDPYKIGRNRPEQAETTAAREFFEAIRPLLMVFVSICGAWGVIMVGMVIAWLIHGG